MPGPLGELQGAAAARHFAADPIPVLDAQGRLRGIFLREETVRRRRGHASGGSMRLIEIAAIFQVRHYSTDGGGAERLFIAPGNGARGYRLARFNVSTDDVRQNLTVTAFLKSRITHSSTPQRVLTPILGSLS